MPSFSDSFWTNGYSTGINILFDKLEQGCVENEEVVALASARAEAEELYGNKLKDIQLFHSPKRTGFGKDDGASLKKAFEGVTNEMGEEGRSHIQIADNIRRMVILPFSKWSDEHRQRVEYSRGVLKAKLRTYEKELKEVQKCQKQYFNKCRVLEDYKESGAASDAAEASATAALAAEQVELVPSSFTETPTIKVPDELVEIGDEHYTHEEAKAWLAKMLREIPQQDVKVPILGTYDHVSTGDKIVQWYEANYNLLRGIPAGDPSSKDKPSTAQAELFGQSLISEGFLRLVGQVGKKFANSSVMFYQWRRRAYELAGKGQELEQRNLNLTPLVGEYLGETIQNYISNPHPDETPEQRLTREVRELDNKYLQAVITLDDARCSLEETLIDHSKFMERCEYDRLKAIKAVFLDFLAALSNAIPVIQSSVDKVLLYQETIHPANDLRYLLESYRTGCFSPKVTVYDNYYNSAEDLIFGVDLELRCRGDKKKVPLIVSSILSFMDAQYPEMENDQARLGAWTVSVPLKATHSLRRQLNFSKASPLQVLPKDQIPVVVSVLKLYLTELPDSVVPSQLYDVIRSIYSVHGNDENPEIRINSIQNTFAQMRVSNIATLNAIMTHLSRLISIANAPDEYKNQLAQELSYCILRPRGQSSLTIGDRHAYRLVMDLLTYKDQIFKGLKRSNSDSGSIYSPLKSRSDINLPRSSNSAEATPVEATPTDGAEVSRRPTLQNRIEALSLKIKKDKAYQPGSRSGRRISEKSSMPEKVTDTVTETGEKTTGETPGNNPTADKIERNGTSHGQDSRENGAHGNDHGPSDAPEIEASYVRQKNANGEKETIVID